MIEITYEYRSPDGHYTIRKMLFETKGQADYFCSKLESSEEYKILDNRRI